MPALPREATVAIFGAGAMGSGIAQVAAQAGHRVLMFDARINAADEAKRRIADTLIGLAAKGRLTDADARSAVARIETIHALGDSVSAKLVIEAIVEELEPKRELFRQLEVVVAPSAILASNTSSFSITALAAGLRYPARFVGMHFFNPAPLMPLVEVVSGLGTDRAVAETVHATAASWGKSPVHAISSPGFIVNRCARPFYAEALRLLAERAADPATIDAVMREAGGFRMGPFELMDMIGHDVNFAVTRSVWEAYFYDPRFTPSPLQQELVLAGFLGRKSGRGFYDYASGAAKPEPLTEPARPLPDRIVACGDLGAAAALVERMSSLGLQVERRDAHESFPSGVIAAGGAWLALSDGRTATERAGASGAHDLVLFDLTHDFHAAKRIAVARADTCSDAAYGAAIGLLQAAGLAVSPIDDVAGLPVLRTVAMLANEAADAVQQRIASAEDVDLAMQKGVSYPLGPLAWGDSIGCNVLYDVLRNMLAATGSPRYRVSPLIARRCATGGSLLGG
jgi:3-hydroxybutyryl-CoA dehydrogenase